MAKGTARKRKYDSSGRKARAFESHSKIVEAARELFIAKGYSGVRIQAISRMANVSQETVYSVFKNKHTILALASGLAVETGGGPVPAMLEPYMREVASERNQQRQIRLFARRMQMFFSRVAPIVEVMRAAAKSEPEINTLLTKYLNDRFQGMVFFVECLLANGPLQNGVSKLLAAETIWGVASADVYSLLVRDRGWSAEEYEAWLSDSLDKLLLP